MRLQGTSVAAAVLALGLLACSENSKDGDHTAGLDRAAPVSPRPHADLACSDCHSTDFASNITGHASGTTCTQCHATSELSEEVVWGGVRFAHISHPGAEGQEHLDCSACHTHSSGDIDLGLSTSSCVLCHGDTFWNNEEVAGTGTGTATGAKATGRRDTRSNTTARLAVLPESDCGTCHGVALHQAPAGIGRPPINHATVTERGLSCLQCHFDVVRGTGAVDPASCAECHLSAGTSQPLERAQLRYEPGTAGADIHRAHYSGGQGPSCARCHTEIAHEVGNLLDAVSLDCSTCHTEDEFDSAEIDSTYHEPQQLLFAGLIPGDASAQPSVKFLARLGCRSCHEAKGSEGHLLGLTESCVSCHGQKFDGLSAGWAAGMTQRTEASIRYIQTAGDAIGSNASTEVTAALERARELVDWIDKGGGVHNLTTSDAILRDAIESTEEAYRLAGRIPPRRPALGPAVAENECMHCHYGVDVDPFRSGAGAAASGPTGVASRSTRVASGGMGSVGSGSRGLGSGSAFPHAAHVAVDTDCSECHSPAELFQEDGKTFDPDHGKTFVSDTDCHRCHHVQTFAEYKAVAERRNSGDGDGLQQSAGSRACARCHSGMERLPEKPTTMTVAVSVRNEFGSNQPERDVAWSHARHASVACEECHTQSLTMAVSADAADCSGCHDSHHEEGRNCSSCHTGYNIQAAHSVENPHFHCADCHNRNIVSMLHPQPEYCQTCHTGISEHVAERQTDAKTCVECHMLTSPAKYRQRILEGS